VPEAIDLGDPGERTNGLAVGGLRDLRDRVGVRVRVRGRHTQHVAVLIERNVEAAVATDDDRERLIAAESVLRGNERLRTRNERVRTWVYATRQTPRLFAALSGTYSKLLTESNADWPGIPPSTRQVVLLIGPLSTRQVPTLRSSTQRSGPIVITPGANGWF
jgi:hypothetical protein